jgi:hypothetical protein
MNRWDAPDSVFAPLVAAVPPGTEWPGFISSFIWAAEGIPQATLVYRIKRPGTFQKTHELRDRKVTAYTGDGVKPFGVRARLQDVTRGERATGSPDSTFWVVGLNHLKDGLCVPAVPADHDSAILQLARFQLTKDGLVGAPQLALLRHRWAEAVRTASPDALVFGGQHHWVDEWWTETLPTPSDAK